MDKEIYFKHKNEGLSDREIADFIFHVSDMTLSRWKRKNGIQVGQRIMKARKGMKRYGEGYFKVKQVVNVNE
jgi:transposase